MLLRIAIPIVIWILISGGCASQQKKTSEPSPPQPQSSQSEQRTPPKAEKAAETQPAGGKAAPAEKQRSEESAEAQLKTAREKLQVSLETENRVQTEFEKLKQTGQASEAVTKDYETYISRVKGLVDENRQMVEKLEAVIAAQSQDRSTQGAGEDGTLETAQLDRQLDQSLSEFDEMLLQEMDKIQSQSERKMTGLAEEAAAAAERLRKRGIDVGGADGEEPSSPRENGEGSDADQGERAQTEATGSTGQAGEQDSAGREGRSAETETGMAGSEQAKTDTGGDAGGTKSKDRRGGYSEADDDIVARQLREAAENETDPELKEKLWKEYEDYKRNTGR